MENGFFKNAYKVYISNLAGANSDYRYYKTLKGAERRFDELVWTRPRTDFRAVVMIEIATNKAIRVG